MISVFLVSLTKIVLSIVSLFVSPVVSGVTSLFPDLLVYYNYIIDFFGMAFTYLTTVLRWFLFTPNMLMLLFDYFLVKWSIWVIGCTIRFGINMWHHLKL